MLTARLYRYLKKRGEHFVFHPPHLKYKSCWWCDYRKGK